MVTRDFMVRCAIAHSNRSVGHAFCKALGVLPLAARHKGGVVYERHDQDVMECFANKRSPMDYGVI